MFSSDRGQKYGWGALRLVSLTIAFLCYFDRSLKVVGTSTRWISFVLLGGIGAIVNVKITHPIYNMMLLLICGGAIVFDLQYDATMAIYLFKTLGGDFIAGKLDTLEWQISGVFSMTVAASCAIFSQTVVNDYGRIFPLLFVMQVFCEYGDNHFERFKFFRHRYSFELIHTLILFNLPGMTAPELRVLLMDLIACSAYRTFNYAIIVVRKLIASDFFISAPRMILYHIRGYLQGFRVQYVRDSDVAVAVMKQSECKGYVLERVLSCPAWAPIISLESIDGTLWQDMRKDFTTLLKMLPSPEKLKEIAKKHLDILIDRTERKDNSYIIDANEIALVTMKVFVEFVFQREWEPEFDILVLSSWEWRKEIAAKGEGNPETKRQAVEVTINLIKESTVLWGLFGEKWKEPRYYSLVMQPFLISPTINTGDLAVAFLKYPELDVTEAMRQMHPFPILERWIKEDIVVERPSPHTSSFSTSGHPHMSKSGSGKCPFRVSDNDDDENTELDDSPTKLTNKSAARGSKLKTEKEKDDKKSINNENEGKTAVVVKGKTQVVMFPSDWRSDTTWSVFGAGKRACPGAHFALPWLKEMRDMILFIKQKEDSKKDNSKNNQITIKYSKIQPELNHLYSGRNNDSKVTFHEVFYFLTTIVPKILFTSKLDGGEEC